MEAKIIAIGNSKGVRLPRSALSQAKLTEGDTVRVSVRNRSIVLAATRRPRAGWAEAFRAAGAGSVREDLWGAVPLDEAWDR